MLKTAIVGCGGIAHSHAECIKTLECAQLIAFTDIKLERAEAFAQEFGGKVYDSIDNLLCSEKFDVLHICTPHCLHVPMAVMAHAKNINIFMEKPPAVTLSDIRILKKLSKSPKIGVCFQNRYIGSVQHLKQMLDQNVYGAVKGARAFVTWNREAPYYTESGWRGTWEHEGGGVLVNQSIHTLDLLVYLLGEPMYVDASCANHHLKGIIQVEDTVEAYINFNGCITLFYATTSFCTDSPVFIEFFCEAGRIRMEGNTVTEYPADKNPITTDYPMKYLGKEYWGAGHLLCIQDFYRCIQNGEKFPIEIDDISCTVELMLGIYESAATRQTIKFL